MARPWSRVALASFCSAAFAGCMSQPEARSGALDYLTRKGSKEVDDAEVKLSAGAGRHRRSARRPGDGTDVRAGLPPTTHRISPETISDRKRRELLDRFTNEFKTRPAIAFGADAPVDLPDARRRLRGACSAPGRRSARDRRALVDQFQFNEAGGSAFELEPSAASVTSRARRTRRAP